MHNTAIGHATDTRLAKLHQVLLMMMKDFRDLCEQESIVWIAMYGTAIGALRHKGFIPWDDDIDLCLLRSDYDRLKAAVAKRADEKYEIIDSQTNPRYPLATGRFMLKGTEFRDANLATMDFDSCIFLDLFALDNIPDNDKAYRKQATWAWFYNKLAIAKLTANPYIAGNSLASHALRIGTRLARATLNAPGIRRVDLNRRSRAWQTRYNNNAPTKRVGYLCDTSRFSCTYELNDLLPVRMAPFEDMEIPLANHAEQLLEEYYGDYMTPPPVELRHEHYPEVLDLGPYENMFS